MTRRLISTGSRFETLACYSRAVVLDDRWIIVSGTMGQNPDSGDMPTSFTAQARNSLRTIERALAEAGASLADVVRCGVYLRDRSDVTELIAILAETFAEIRPANTTVICQFPDEQAKIEIEVMAYRHR